MKVSELDYNHSENKRFVPESKTIVVFIHGILGTPRHFADFEKLVPQNWSICNILLKGHGGTVKDFSDATMQEWKSQIKAEVDSLSTQFETMFLVAHSMGCLFSLYMNDIHPNLIKGLFFLAPPLKVTLKMPIIITSIKIIFELKISDESTLAAKNAYSIGREKNLLKYVKWLPNFISLLKESRHSRKYACKLKAPCYVFMSKKDELVKPSSAEFFNKHGEVMLHTLKESQHFYYEKKDYEYLLTKFEEFCIEMSK